MACGIAGLNKLIVKTSKVKSPKAEATVKELKELRDLMYEEKYNTVIAEALKSPELTPAAAVSNMLETDDAMLELIAANEEAIASADKAYGKFINNKTHSADSTSKVSNRKKGDYKEGANAIAKATKAIEASELEIDELNKQVAIELAKADKASTDAKTKYFESNAADIQKDIDYYKKNIKWQEAKISYAKGNVTRSQTLYTALQDAQELATSTREDIKQYKSIYSTGGQILIQTNNRPQKGKKANPFGDVNNVRPSDYFVSKQSSTDVLNTVTLLNRAIAEREGDRSKRSSNIAKSRDAVAVVIAGARKFIEGELATGVQNLKIMDATSSNVAGYQNIAKVFTQVRDVNKVVDGKTFANTKVTLNDTVLKAVGIGAVDWAINVGGENRAFNRSNDDARRLLGKNTEATLSPTEVDVIANFDGIVTSQAQNMGKTIWDLLGLKAKPTTEDSEVNHEKLVAKMQVELGLLGFKALESAGILKLHADSTDEKKATAKQEASVDDSMVSDDYGVAIQGKYGAIIAAHKEGKFVEGYATPSSIIYGEGSSQTGSIATYSFTGTPSEYESFSKKSISGNSVITGIGATGFSDLQDALGTTKKLTGPYFVEGENTVSNDAIVNQGLSAKTGETPDTQKAAIQKQDNTSWVFNRSFEATLDAITSVLGENGFLRLLGWVDPEGTHVDDRGAVRGKNLSLERQYKYLQEARDNFDKSASKKMWFKWYVVTNGRFGIKSNTFNIQDQKLHRNAVNQEEYSVTKDSPEETIMVLAMAQGLGIGVDKLTVDASKAKFEKLTAEIDKILGAEFSEVTPEQITKAYTYLVTKTGAKDEPEHALQALSEYIKYGQWVQGKREGKLTTGITLETDAITSGFILKILQMPIFKDDSGVLDIAKVKKYLKKGGISDHIVDKDGKTLNESYEEWKMDKANKDSYETVAIAFGKALEKSTSEDVWAHILYSKVFKAGGELNDKQQKHVASIAKQKTKDANAMMSLLGESTFLDKVLAVSRNFMKNPFMVFNYGSAVTSIVNSQADTAIANINKLLTVAAKANHPDEDKDIKAEDANAAKGDQAMRVLAEAIVGSAETYKLLPDTTYNDYKIIDERRNELVGIADSMMKAYNDNPDSMLEFKLDDDVKQAIHDRTVSAISKPLDEAFNEEYGEFLEAGRTINNSMVMMMRLAMPKLEAAIDDKVAEVNAARLADGKRPRQLTGSEIDDIIFELRDIMPILNMPLGDGDKSTMFLAGEEQGEYNSEYKYNAESYTGFNNFKATSKAYRLVEKFTSGAVIPIHFMDGSIQSRVLSMFKALGVHDANFFNVTNAKEGTREYNKAVIELAKSWSLTTEVLTSAHNSLLNASIEEMEAIDDGYFIEQMLTTSGINYKIADDVLPQLAKSYRTGGIAGAANTANNLIINSKDKATINTLDKLNESIIALADVGAKLPNTVRGIYNGVVDLQKASEEGREALFNNNPQFIEHAALEGGEYIEEAKPYAKHMSTSVSPNVTEYADKRINEEEFDRELSRQVSKKLGKDGKATKPGIITPTKNDVVSEFKSFDSSPVTLPTIDGVSDSDIQSITDNILTPDQYRNC